MGGAVPGVDGRELRHEIRLALGAHLLGEVGVFHIHEVLLIEAAHCPESAGAHRREAAGAELDLGGAGQVFVLHKVGIVVLCPESERRQLAVDHGAERTPAQRQLLGAAIREDERRPGHDDVRVLVHPVGQVAQGVRRQLDVRVEDEVIVAVQFRQDHIVAGAEAAVLSAAADDDLLPLPCCQQAAVQRCFQLLAAAVRAGVVHQIEGQRVAAGEPQNGLCRLQRLVVPVIDYNTS